MTGLKSMLGWAWRLLGTALSFGLFGFGGIFLGLVLIPLLFTFEKDARKRQFITRKWIGKAFSWFIAVMKLLGVLTYDVRHAERLKNLSGTLIIANHPTLIDVVFLISFFPQAECVIKQAVSTNIFMRSTVSAANYISNRDPLELLLSCSERLRQGNNLILFPEATRSVPGKALQFKHGAASVAVRSGADILPIIIRCTPTTLSKGEAWYSVPSVRPHWEFEILRPLRRLEYASGVPGSRQEMRMLNERLCTLFEQALKPGSTANRPTIRQL